MRTSAATCYPMAAPSYMGADGPLGPLPRYAEENETGATPQDDSAREDPGWGHRDHAHPLRHGRTGARRALVKVMTYPCAALMIRSRMWG
jgi:hypothetical protein